MKILNANNDIISREITTHDNKNNKLEEMKYIQENLTQKSNYQYNPQGKKVEETKENFGKLVYHRIYKYDNMDNLLQIIEENSDGKSFVSYQYQYDTKGNPLSERWTKDSSSEYSSKIHKYLPNDLLSESDCYLASYKFSVLYKYTYQYF